MAGQHFEERPFKRSSWKWRPVNSASFETTLVDYRKPGIAWQPETRVCYIVIFIKELSA